MLKSRFSRYQIATAIAILFHAIGLIGILFLDRAFFIRLTPIHLLLMGGLIFYTQYDISEGICVLFLSCLFLGYLFEVIGTSTGLLFGNYSYGQSLGGVMYNVPVIIGVNWFIIIYCCGIIVSMIFSYLGRITSIEAKVQSPLLKFLSVVIDGATLAVFIDWFLEPAAVKLGYWQWVSGEIPPFNYFCWFIVSSIFLTIFQFCKFPRRNKFAVNLLLIQLMFFLLIRTFL